MCGPAQYFWPDRVLNVGFKYRMTKPENAIVGGGQVFDQLEDLVEQVSPNPPGDLVAWGVGLPRRQASDARVRDVLKSFALFGTRNHEWREEIDFVPCASCMAPAFDTVTEPQHEVVVFAHRRKTPTLMPRDGIPFMTNNNRPAAEVIRFLAQGETVVTSSYHGVYWAQLLGRKVLCVPYNDKFRTLEHAVTIGTPEGWQEEFRAATRTDPLLQAYRDINRSFAARVAALWGWDE